MTDYRIEAATKEEWAERALRAEANAMKASNAALLEKRRADEAQAKLEKAKGILEREIQRVQEIQSVFPPPHNVGLVYVEEEYRRMLVEMMGGAND